MAKRVYCCSICEGVHLSYICTTCANSRLTEKYKILTIEHHRCNVLYKRLNERLTSKCKGDERKYWRHIQDERLSQLKQQLELKRKQLHQGKEKLEEKKRELISRSALLEGASNTLQKKRMEQLKYYSDLIHTQSLNLTNIRLELLNVQTIIIKHLLRVFPIGRINCVLDTREASSSGQYDVICKLRLPRGLNPQSVSPDELSASLSCMLQLLNLVASYLFAPLLLKSGFAASCSRVWQRASYWEDRPASQSQEYPLFIPRQDSMIANPEASSTFGVASMESPRIPNIDYGSSSSSFNNGSSLTRSLKIDKDVQEGILLLKKAVACVTAYCVNAFYRSSPAELSTFEAFGKMLTFISSKEARSVLSSKESKTRQMLQSSMLAQQDHVADPKSSPFPLEETKHRKPERRFGSRSGLSRTSSFLYTNEVADIGRNESTIDGWDIVEHPKLPPPPSHTEDVEHWTRAMIIDAKKP
eukprot:TRINITY_DN7272_c0_g1_i1.p1 TRINITY_DN7272_c0_g1~~TRINITY_DN7272_c0_g1_i1.p1  ORF type:complete len:472 (+),score=99.40 TRINITY_DN7272_c0_g1_i1:199-1614(+)